MFTKLEKIKLILDLKKGRITPEFANRIKTGIIIIESKKELDAVNSYIERTGIKIYMFVAFNLTD
jgi:hypothetical protein